MFHICFRARPSDPFLLVAFIFVYCALGERSALKHCCSHTNTPRETLAEIKGGNYVAHVMKEIELLHGVKAGAKYTIPFSN